MAVWRYDLYFRVLPISLTSERSENKKKQRKPSISLYAQSKLPNQIQIVFLFRHLGCEYKLETNSGSFDANNYPAYQYCSWSITVKHGLEVFLKFTTLNIPDCSENQLEVYDGFDNTGSLLAAYCAENATSGNTVRSTGNNMYVMFKSGNDNSGSLQFQARYEAKEPITGNKHKRNFPDSVVLSDFPISTTKPPELFFT
jgi:hypothetical protein